MRLLWLLINLIQGVWVVLWTVLWITVALVTYLVTRSRRPGLFLARRVWAPGILAAGPARLEVHGLEKLDLARPYLFAANHQSFVDIPALFAALPVPLLFLGKIELARIPFLGWYMRAMGMVFIDRSDKARSARSVERITRRLREGWSLLSFPEGTRSPDGRLQRFRSATFAAAIDTGVPVVPVALEGATRVFPRNGVGARPGTIRIFIGEPIHTEGLTRDTRVDLADRTQRAVGEMLASHAETPRPDSR
jgi:1-acyl-sn-glycerol-3-phosphate acyltransferase